MIEQRCPTCGQIVPDDDMSRICRACHKTKVLSHFYNKADGKYGKASICIDCEKARHNKYLDSKK